MWKKTRFAYFVVGLSSGRLRGLSDKPNKPKARTTKKPSDLQTYIASRRKVFWASRNNTSFEVGRFDRGSGFLYFGLPGLSEDPRSQRLLSPATTKAETHRSCSLTT